VRTLFAGIFGALFYSVLSYLLAELFLDGKKKKD